MAVLIGFIFHHMRSTSSRRPTNRSSLSNANFIWWAISSSNSRFLFARWSRSRSNGGKSFSSSCFAISLWPFRLSITTWCAVLLLMNLFKSCCLSKFSSLKSFYGFSNWCWRSQSIRDWASFWNPALGCLAVTDITLFGSSSKANLTSCSVIEVIWWASSVFLKRICRNRGSISSKLPPISVYGRSLWIAGILLRSCMKHLSRSEDSFSSDFCRTSSKISDLISAGIGTHPYRSKPRWMKTGSDKGLDLKHLSISSIQIRFVPWLSVVLSLQVYSYRENSEIYRDSKVF